MFIRVLAEFRGLLTLNSGILIGQKVLSVSYLMCLILWPRIRLKSGWKRFHAAHCRTIRHVCVKSSSKSALNAAKCADVSCFIPRQRKKIGTEVFTSDSPVGMISPAPGFVFDIHPLSIQLICQGGGEGGASPS